MAAPGIDHSDEAKNRGQAVRREVRAANSIAVIVDSGWDGGSNGSVAVISCPMGPPPLSL